MVLFPYTPVLFHLKKFILSQKELEWKRIVAMFLHKKMHVDQRLQERWWADTQHNMRKGTERNKLQ